MSIKINIRFSDKSGSENLTPIKCYDAQPLDEHGIQLSEKKNIKNEEFHAIGSVFSGLWYKFQLRKYSHYVTITFCTLTFLLSSGAPL